MAAKKKDWTRNRGKQPVADGVWVEVRYRDGEIRQGRAGNMAWMIDGPTALCGDADIMAWRRICKPRSDKGVKVARAPEPETVNCGPTVDNGAPAEVVPQADADGWIEHDGKGCPLPIGTYVQCYFRDSTTYFGRIGSLDYDVKSSVWIHDGVIPEWEVVRYRVTERAPSAEPVPHHIAAISKDLGIEPAKVADDIAGALPEQQAADGKQASDYGLPITDIAWLILGIVAVCCMVFSTAMQAAVFFQ